MLPEALELLACPRCQGALEDQGALHAQGAPDVQGAQEGQLRCAACGAAYRSEGGVPDLRLDADVRTEAVRAFYTEAPFPNYPPRDSHAWLRARAGRSELLRQLDRAIAADARVLELGCGTGQLSLFLASADRLVIGADLTRASLALAESARRRYGVERALFVETDLRAPGLRPRSFDVVYSSGVLHHTPDPRASFAAIAQLARPGGTVIVGLYNAYARFPHRLRRGVARLTGLRFVPFDPVLRDRRTEPARREAWLRDQYLHVEEHRHTLSEVQGWFRENGVEYLRAFPDTSLAQEPLRDGELFSPAEDDWPFENVLAQLSWARTLSHEGGLFLAIGRTRTG